ncbi:unnamed protein product [Rhodiola kirilowii]
MDILTMILCLILFTSSLIFLAKTIRQDHSNLPPGPARLPVIGNLHLLDAKPHKSLAELAETHGPIMSLKLGQLTTIIISSASAARLVLHKQDHSFANRFVPDSFKACDHGKFSVAWTPLSPKWRQLRKICSTYIFSSQKIEASGYLMKRKIEELIADAQKKCTIGESFSIGEAAFKTSINMLSRVIFSMDLVDGETERAMEFKMSFRSMMELGGFPNLVDYFPWLERADPLRMRARMEPHFANLLSLFNCLVVERLANRVVEQGQGQASLSSKNGDVLDSLLNILEDKNEDVTRNDINHLLLDLFVAGTDTTASTLEWAMAEVLKNPEIMSKAKSELKGVTKKSKPIEDGDISRLPYLQAIVNETLRLHPATPLLLPRRTSNVVDLNGYTIPKGAQVVVNAWAIGRDPCSWDTPEIFSPERFLGSNVSFVGGSFELIPFGGGRRVCPGVPLAVKMLHLMLGSLISCFDWKVEDGVLDGEDIDMDDKFGLTLQKTRPLRAVPIAI